MLNKRRNPPLVLLAAACIFAAGCTMHSPAARDADPDYSLPASTLLRPTIAWPTRTTNDLPQVAARTPHEISWWRLDGTKPPDELEPRILRRVQRPDAIVSYAGVHGVGIIRVFEPPPAPTGDRPESTSTPGPGEGSPVAAAGRQFAPMRFFSLSQSPDHPMDQRIKRLRRWMERSASTSRAGVCLNDPEVLSMLWEGTGIRVVPPKPGIAPAGVVLHMPGLGSMEYEQPALDQLTERGWWIVRIATPRLWWLEEKSFSIKSPADIAPLARSIASLVDDLLAEPAFASEAALDYLAKHRPEVPQRPVILLGMSAGALMMPAVAARLHDRVDGMVLVGGGANLLQISQESDLTDGGLKLDWNEDLHRGILRKQLYKKYLEESHLDPYTLAPAIKDIPTLLVLANLDSIVPAETGRLLWNRLGRPERYTTPFGHALLFWQLSQQAGRIANWIDAAGARARSAESTHSAASPAASTP